MADVINLRLARKRKARGEKQQAAAGNRALHGRTRAERQLEQAREAREQAHLAGHKRERNGDE